MTDKIIESEKDLLFSHFTLENLHEAVFWIDEHSNFVRINNAACKISGYSKEALLKMSMLDINPTETKKSWTEHWKEVKELKKVTLQTIHRHKKGHLYDIEVTNNYIEFDGKEFSCSIVKDISKKKD